jgi:hypothetical protein
MALKGKRHIISVSDSSSSDDASSGYEKVILFLSHPVDGM